eukprot:c26802_g1_i1.p1 GENE.c26802_g1_i1~~c26802_g1_i1.p1  ORF type:complete len:491 (-),score=81.15 c26802_g1_i1:83-1555(-)
MSDSVCKNRFFEDSLASEDIDEDVRTLLDFRSQAAQDPLLCTSMKTSSIDSNSSEIDESLSNEPCSTPAPMQCDARAHRVFALLPVDALKACESYRASIHALETQRPTRSKKGPRINPHCDFLKSAMLKIEAHLRPPSENIPLALCELYSLTIVTQDINRWQYDHSAAQSVVRALAKLWRRLLRVDDVGLGLADLAVQDPAPRSLICESLNDCAKQWKSALDAPLTFNWKPPGTNIASKRRHSFQSTTSSEPSRKKRDNRSGPRVVYEFGLFVGEQEVNRVCVYGSMTLFNLHRCLQVVLDPQCNVEEIETATYRFVFGEQCVGVARTRGVHRNGRSTDIDDLDLPCGVSGAYSAGVVATAPEPRGTEREWCIVLRDKLDNVSRSGLMFKEELMPRSVGDGAQCLAANKRLCHLRFNPNPAMNKTSRQGPALVCVKGQDANLVLEDHLVKTMARGVAEELEAVDSTCTDQQRPVRKLRIEPKPSSGRGSL